MSIRNTPETDAPKTGTQASKTASPRMLVSLLQFKFLVIGFISFGFFMGMLAGMPGPNYCAARPTSDGGGNG